MKTVTLNKFRQIINSIRLDKKKEIKTLFLDIGGVLVSNGWDRFARQKAVKKFNLDPNELSDRHGIFFETYESGKLTLKEYLDNVIFYEPRDFTEMDFMNFMFQQSLALKGSIEYFMGIKKKYKLNVLALSNEGRELNDYRIKTFKLDKLFNFFVSSCYVHLRKPDKDIFKMACDVSHTTPQHALFVDDRIIHVRIAGSLGINAIQFRNLATTKKQMAAYGFTI
ncbi:HAD family phosphatase [soil metagenome]